MSRLNSSTFSSEPRELRRAGRLVLCVLACLALLDVAANLAFAFPDDPKNMSPGKLAMYFDYGRSTEGRLRRMTRVDPGKTAPITLAGWYRPLVAHVRTPRQGVDTVTVYGMSHAVRLADALDRVAPNFEVRSVGAPGATTNWSFGAFLRDRGNRRSNIVVLAIMSSTLPAITTLSPMTWNSTQPIPYTQDRYVVKDGALAVIRPPYEGFPDFVRSFGDQDRWARARAVFRRYDSRYDRFIMEATPLDHSTIVRLLRRAYRQRIEREERGAVLDSRHFDAESEPLLVANAIIAEFARRARAQQQIPVVYVVNNFGYGDQLSRALRRTIHANCIPALESDRYVSPSDPRNYLPDSHFTDENDDLLARNLAEIVAREKAASGRGARSVPCTGRRPPRSL